MPLRGKAEGFRAEGRRDSNPNSSLLPSAFDHLPSERSEVDLRQLFSTTPFTSARFLRSGIRFGIGDYGKVTMSVVKTVLRSQIGSVIFLAGARKQAIIAHNKNLFDY
jgi:hypothetical protein